ncbi:hypothetical protein YPPY66_0477 [Yersinia pestis PY-66]|nr:hypothetical protein YPPY66_0477 [Yersinia pestis PY-66]
MRPRPPTDGNPLKVSSYAGQDSVSYIVDHFHLDTFEIEKSRILIHGELRRQHLFGVIDIHCRHLVLIRLSGLLNIVCQLAHWATYLHQTLLFNK